MTKLPDKFTKRGFTFTLERRKENAAIYRQQSSKIKDASVAYEVIRPQTATKRFIDGSWQDSAPYEAYPSSETWGTFGWTYTDLDKALERYNAIP